MFIPAFSQCNTPPLFANMQYLFEALATGLHLLAASSYKVRPRSTNVSLVELANSATLPVLLCVSLGVPGKPQISGFENPVRDGETVTLTCTSTGSKPPARLRWFKGREEVEGERCSARVVFVLFFCTNQGEKITCWTFLAFARFGHVYRRVDQKESGCNCYFGLYGSNLSVSYKNRRSCVCLFLCVTSCCVWIASLPYCRVSLHES